MAQTVHPYIWPKPPSDNELLSQIRAMVHGGEWEKADRLARQLSDHDSLVVASNYLSDHASRRGEMVVEVLYEQKGYIWPVLFKVRFQVKGSLYEETFWKANWVYPKGDNGGLWEFLFSLYTLYPFARFVDPKGEDVTDRLAFQKRIRGLSGRLSGMQEILEAQIEARKDKEAVLPVETVCGVFPEQMLEGRLAVADVLAAQKNRRELQEMARRARAKQQKRVYSPFWRTVHSLVSRFSSRVYFPWAGKLSRFTARKMYEFRPGVVPTID